MGHLVVGLGGTGFKAVCMLKAALQASSPTGQLPPQVALLAVDTEHPDTALIEKLSEVLGYGGAPLDREEYVWLGANDPPIGANLQPVALALEEGGLPRGHAGAIQSVPVDHWTSWFQATTLINVLDPHNWNVTIGASQQRQIARLALFWNVQTPGVSPFHRKLSAGIQSVGAGAGADLRLMLIGSTVGGTGAGLFVDVACLVRKLVPAGTTCNVTAFLLLPGAFEGVGLGDQEINDAQARTYATLREMEHYTLGLMTQTQGYRVVYNPGSPLAAYRGDQGTRDKLLDAVYYLDGANNLNQVAPENGVIPLIADVALALLSETGAARRAHMTNVVTTFRGGAAPAQGANPAVITQFLARDNFSCGVGSFGIVLPMARIVDALAWRLVQEAAELLAVPGERAGRLSPNRPGGAAGRREVATPFCAVGPITGRHRDPHTQTEDNLSAGSTDLLQDILTQGRLYGEGANPVQVEAVARQFENRTPGAWKPKLLLRATDNADAFNAAWDGELNKSFMTDDPDKPVMVPVVVKGEAKPAAWGRVRHRVNEEMVNILGTEQGDGTFSGGSLQGLLNGVKLELLQVLRRRLWLQALNVLNGQTPAGGQAEMIRQQRANSVGYLHDFVTELAGLFSAYERGIRTGQTRRNASGGKAETSKKEYDDVCKDGDKNPAPGFGGVRAQNLRRRLLDAAQNLLDLRCTEQIEAMVLDLLTVQQQDLASLQAQLLAPPTEIAPGWGQMLAVGGTDSVLSAAAAGKLQAEQAGRGHACPVREVIWDDVYNNSLYDHYGGDGAVDVVAALDWWLVQPGERGSAGFGLQLWAGATRLADASGVQRAMVQQARRAFDLAWQQESVLEYMAERATTAQWAPGTVAARLQERSPLALAAGGAGQESMYLIVPAPSANANVAAYHSQLLQAVQGVPPDRLKKAYVGSDRFRLTFIHWRDLIGVNNMPSFAAAEGYYQAYWSKHQFPNPRLPSRLTAETLQVLPGEVEAVGIEAQLRRVSVQPPLSRRRLDHEVVQQLENLAHVRKFVNAWAWGVIAERTHDLAGQAATVFEFTITQPPAGTRRGEIREYWLTEPATHSFVQALWDWNYELKDRHPGPVDEADRQRPNGVFGDKEVANIVKDTDEARRTCLDEWLAGHPQWQADIAPTEKAIFAGLPQQRQERAARRWAEAMYVQDKLDELRRRETQAVETKEKDAIAALMVLLWQNLETANQAWSAELNAR